MRRLLSFTLVLTILSLCICCEAESQTSAFEVGTSVYFGHYEQDGNESNGDEPIEWIVLDHSGSKILLLSKYVLDSMQFNTEKEPINITWEECSLNRWLNNDFYNSAFSGEEQVAIGPSSNVSSQDFSAYFKEGAIYTATPVFLLNSAERKKYFPNEGDYYASPTITLYQSGSKAASFHQSTTRKDGRPCLRQQTSIPPRRAQLA